MGVIAPTAPILDPPLSGNNVTALYLPHENRRRGWKLKRKVQLGQQFKLGRSGYCMVGRAQFTVRHPRLVRGYGYSLGSPQAYDVLLALVFWLTIFTIA
jgi:hypothetical protein